MKELEEQLRRAADAATATYVQEQQDALRSAYERWRPLELTPAITLGLVVIEKLARENCPEDSFVAAALDWLRRQKEDQIEVDADWRRLLEDRAFRRTP